MAEGNTYQQVRLVIGNKEIKDGISGSVRIPGNSQLNTLNIKINNPEIQNMALYGKNIELYINDGSYDSVPTFRGFISDINPSDKGVSINASDMRSKLTGNKGLRLTLTDKNNYDGHTLGQFLFSYLNEFIDDEDIGTEYLNDTSPPVYMTGERGVDMDVYSLIKKKVKESIDTTQNILFPLEHFVDVYDGNSRSSIVFKKNKLITSVPSMTFSYSDGLKRYAYKRRIPANTVTYEGRKFSYGNSPKGITSTKLPKQDSPAETRNLALQNILIAQQETDEISIEVTKGWDIGLGDIVNLDIDDEDITGNHRVQGKTIAFGDKSTCTLKLNKLPPTLQEYIS